MMCTDLGTSGTTPPHGTTRGYDAGCREACCRVAAAAYEYRRRIDAILGKPYTLPSLGSARRIQGLVALGWTFGQIADRLGRSHDYPRRVALRSDTFVRTTTAENIAAVYKQMCMALPPSETGRDRWRIAYAKNTAARYGWVPPLSWDDIDDPSEVPGSYPQPPVDDALSGGPTSLDAVVVERILSGEWRLPSTPAEKSEVCRRWVSRGGSTYQLEQITGWRVERYYRKDAA